MKTKIIICFGSIIFLFVLSFLLRNMMFRYVGKTSMTVGYKFSGGLSNQGRLSFIKQFGWEVDTNPIEKVKVDLPLEFDNIFDDYNKLQIPLGLDLTKYKGLTVTRYTYHVLNHPVKDQNVRLNLLVYKNDIIAADVSTIELNGFMHGINEKG